MSKISYSGFEVNQKSKIDLLNYLYTTDLFQNRILGGREILHHITTNMGSLEDLINSKKLKHLDFQNELLDSNIKLGEELQVKAVAIGIDESTGVIAFKTTMLDGSKIPSKNKTPHITAYVPPNENAVSSNDITDWISLKKPIIIDTLLNEFTKINGETIGKYTPNDIKKKKKNSQTLKI